MLWDIDLTLIDLPGIGAEWYTHALATVTGETMREIPWFPGRTERAITTEVLAAHGIEADEELVRRMWSELVAVSAAQRDALPERGRALPGAAEALAALAATGGVVQTLVTGNLAEVALHKLSAFDLHGHLDFELGGYGSLSAHRPDLVDHAVRRSAAKHGVEYPPESVVVVGDTPHDIDAALTHGAIGIGVATGRFGMDELRASGAHTALPDLRDTTAVLAAVLR
ncbi:haloacid dehalogenase [Amycolatopsis antarctica]|uniref:Haloacid dehalogenase n=1 Tax=Amycolatopsis antarctica TaxID=1854586 RepID=A0A263CY64_9PSEU|nr:haloacid dehalogenase [Amycolatopsis antarctica]